MTQYNQLELMNVSSYLNVSFIEKHLQHSNYSGFICYADVNIKSRYQSKLPRLLAARLSRLSLEQTVHTIPYGG